MRVLLQAGAEIPAKNLFDLHRNREGIRLGFTRTELFGDVLPFMDSDGGLMDPLGCQLDAVGLLAGDEILEKSTASIVVGDFHLVDDEGNVDAGASRILFLNAEALARTLRFSGAESKDVIFGKDHSATDPEVTPFQRFNRSYNPVADEANRWRCLRSLGTIWVSSTHITEETSRRFVPLQYEIVMAIHRFMATLPQEKPQLAYGRIPAPSTWWWAR